MKSISLKQFENISKLTRYWILKSTTEAGSGHPTSCLSAVELMTTLMFGGFFRADLDHPEDSNNDRLIFSKGHAAPLLYALYAAAGKSQKSIKSVKSKAGVVSEEELMTLRKFGSRLEGHPSMKFPYTEAPTGSLGQGLSIGLGMALNAKYLDKFPHRTYVLLGDSEMAEGSNWEAIQMAAHYKLDNLIGVLDVNRLGQRGETMYGHQLGEYEKRIKAFGWNTVVVKDGNDIGEVMKAYRVGARLIAPLRSGEDGKPTMIIAKTLKGKGVSFLEDKEHWHGKALSKEECEKAVKELGEVDREVRGEVAKPAKAQFLISNSKFLNKSQNPNPKKLQATSYKLQDFVATRDAYGNALVQLGALNPNIVVLDAELSDSTRAEKFKTAFPERFFEMFIAEQNMVGVGLGLARRGKVPFLSTFSAFFTRGYDQVRMAQYSDAHIVFVGSHGGVSIGQDGPSQMGLEDLAMFRTVQGSVVLYPSDAVSTEVLVKEALRHEGIVYIRTTRAATSVIYSEKEKFPIGGSKVLRQSKKDFATVVGAGITLHEALKAYEALRHKGINIRVIDLYSIKPVDVVTLRNAAKETKRIIVVEDHVPEGGIADAVREAISGFGTPVISLAVRKRPVSGKPEELLAYEGIDWRGIMKIVSDVIPATSLAARFADESRRESRREAGIQKQK